MMLSSRASSPRVRNILTTTASMALVSAFASTPAYAQTGDAAVAEALFRSARTLVAAGKYAEACPKFAESQRIDPKLGTLMNLALCHANEGKSASAWAEYTQAAELASRAGQAEREKVARKSAADLEVVLPHVVLRSATSDAITVTWDGKPMGAAVMGTALPVDPGAHELVASAAGRQSFRDTVTVKPGPGEQVVTIPALLPGATPVAPAPVLAQPVAPTEPESTGHPILGYSLVGGGAVAIIVGGVFGGLAFSQKSKADNGCSASLSCNAAGESAVSSMKTDEALSTVLIGAGIISAAAGVYFVVTNHSSSVGERGKEAPPQAGPTAHIDPIFGPGRAGLAVSGSF